MKVIVALTLSALGSLSAHAATAYFTGTFEYVNTVTLQQGVRCEYNYMGNRFWFTFVGSVCPSTVEVQ